MVDRSDKPSGSESAPTPERAANAAPKRYPLERRIVAVTFFVLAGGWGIRGAYAIHADTFREAPASSAPPGTCSEAIRALHGAYEHAFAITVAGERPGELRSRAPLQEPATVAELARLDEQLGALSTRCNGEGEGGQTAYRALEVWRHQAEDVTRLAERVLSPDAQRALGYQSPAPR